MPWHCPACNSIIKHSEHDPKPRVGERYRCHVCRLSLEFDGSVDKLTIAPLETDHYVEPEPARARAIPSPVTVLEPKQRKPERRTTQRRAAQRRKKTERRKPVKRRLAKRKSAKRKSSKPKHK